MDPISTDYMPTVADVSAILRNRVRDENGNDVGVFQPDAVGTTSPTAEDVTSLIADAVSEAYPTFGDSIPDNPGDPTRLGYDKDVLRKSASRIVALRAAALVELTYFADQVGSGRSPYEYLQKSWEEGLVAVGKAVKEAGVGDTPGTSDDALLPQWSMPCNPIVGLDTRW